MTDCLQVLSVRFGERLLEDGPYISHVLRKLLKNDQKFRYSFKQRRCVRIASHTERSWRGEEGYRKTLIPEQAKAVHSVYHQLSSNTRRFILATLMKWTASDTSWIFLLFSLRFNPYVTFTKGPNHHCIAPTTWCKADAGMVVVVVTLVVAT